MAEARALSPLARDAGVSVIVPHFGDPHPTLALLGDLRAQRTDRRVEVVVVDDASPEPFPDTDGVVVLRRRRNGGFGSTVNTGVARSTHPLLLILNSDLRIDSDFVESMARHATAAYPAVVGPRLADGDGVDQHAARRFPRVSHQFVEWLTPLAGLRGRRSLQVAVGYDLTGTDQARRRVDWLVGAALCLPREAFDAAGGFDERFFMNCEEVDLQRRLGAAGVPSMYVGTVTALHRGGGSSSDVTIRRRWLVGARRRYAAKWGGLGRLQVALTVATAANLVWNVLRRVAGRPLHPVATMREELQLIWGPITDPRDDRRDSRSRA